jgi:effector-binding domain-containing protein
MADVTLVEIEPRVGAGIEVRTGWQSIPQTVRATFDRLYAPGAVDRSVHGHNFIVYKDGDRDGVTMVVAIENALPGGADRDIKGVTMPAGRAATAAHFGDYGAMRPTYAAIESWMLAQGLKRTSVSMELYGDWGPDPAKVRTDLFIYIDQRIGAP